MGNQGVACYLYTAGLCNLLLEITREGEINHLTAVIADHVIVRI